MMIKKQNFGVLEIDHDQDNQVDVQDQVSNLSEVSINDQGDLKILDPNDVKQSKCSR